MDELNLKIHTKIMRKIVAKLLSKAISKKFGCKINVQVNGLEVKMIEGTTKLSTNVEMDINNDDFMKVLTDMYLED